MYNDQFVSEAEPLNAIEGGNVGGVEMPSYNVSGRPAFACVNIDLKSGEKVIAEAGAMNWMTSAIDIDTGCPGGPSGACMRCLGGESCFVNTFTGPGRITFGFKEPGDLLPFVVTPGNGWLLTREAFISGTPNCKITAGFPGCLACCCSGEGLFMTKVLVKDQSTGVFFAGGYGEILRHDVPEGKCLFVDTGLFFAAHADTKINIGCIGGLKTFLCSGEGLVMKFFGPCVIFTQSRDPALFRRLQQPQGGRGNGGGGGVNVSTS